MNDLKYPENEREREKISEVSEVFKEYADKFLYSAEQELREQGIDAADINAFSKSFKRVYEDEVDFTKAGQGGYFDDVDDFIDDILRRAISRLDDRALEEKLDVLWGLRAEKVAERIQKKKSGISGNVIEFKKPE